MSKSSLLLELKYFFLTVPFMCSKRPSLSLLEVFDYQGHSTLTTGLK